MQEFTVALESPFNLDFTLASGQAFRWERRGEWWYGVVSGGVLKVRQEGESLRCASGADSIDSQFVRGYFRLDDDIEAILDSIMKDEVMAQAVQRFYGLRLLKQEPWECLASFALATNSNIPRIVKMVSAVSTAFGERVVFEGDEFRSFPKAEAIADASLEALRSCGLGYRTPFLRHIAASVADGKVDLTELRLQDYDSARGILLKEALGEKALLGVGPKVADCVLLYSCGKNEAFPIDVWVARALADQYARLFPKELRAKLGSKSKARLGRRDYDEVSKVVREHYGRYAGYAQLYLYMSARSLKQALP